MASPLHLTEAEKAASTLAACLVTEAFLKARPTDPDMWALHKENLDRAREAHTK